MMNDLEKIQIHDEASIQGDGMVQSYVTATNPAAIKAEDALGNYPLFSGRPFPLTAAKLVQIIMIHGNSYGRKCFGYFFHQKLIQECKWLIPVPIDSIDKNGLLRVLQTYEGNRGMFPCIDGGILRNIYNRAGIGGEDEDF